MSSHGYDEKITEQTALVMEAKEKASVKKVPIPSPGAHQVLLKVHAAGLNPVDFKILWFNWTGQDLPHGLGSDVSGVIVKVGSEVKDWKVGDEVFTTINLFHAGAFAEYAVTEAVRLARKSPKVSHVQAASLPIAFLSAWDAFTKIGVDEKKTIYVPGGAGGVGHFAVQLAKIFNLRVISSGGKEESLKVLQSLGADHILNYSKDNLVEEILKLTDGKGVDYVYDSTYQQSSFEIAAKVLKESGTFFLLGNALAADNNAAKIVAEKKGSFVHANLVPYSKPGVSGETQRLRLASGLNDATRYLESGQVKPVIKTIQFGEALDTLLEMQKGKTFNGKVVVEIVKS